MYVYIFNNAVPMTLSKETNEQTRMIIAVTPACINTTILIGERAEHRFTKDIAVST